MPDTITVRLDFHERGFVVMIADRGGEITFNWDAVGYGHANQEGVRRNVRARVDGLIGKGVLTETPIIGASGTTVWLRLTDIGRNLATAIKAGTPNDPQAG